MTTFQTKKPLAAVIGGTSNRQARDLVRLYAEGHLVLDPPYQRGDVWTVEQQMRLVETWLLGLPIGVLILNDRMGWPYVQGDELPGYAVIDGKQRMTATLAWFSGELFVPASWFKAEQVRDVTITADGPYVSYLGLTDTGRRLCDNRFEAPCRTTRLPSVGWEARVYELVNNTGTAQTKETLARAVEIAAGREAR